MKDRESLINRLRERAARVGIPVKEGDLVRWSDYYELLARWNERINLTGLPLAGYPIKTLDRLFIEPLIASRHISEVPADWLDVGSGGGSPAIPLKVFRPQLRLVMTEPRTRKAAFLREAIRVLALEHASVLETLVQDAPAMVPMKFNLITIRGVRLNTKLMEALKNRLRNRGTLLSFGSQVPAKTDGFVGVGQYSLLSDHELGPEQTRLFLYERA